MKFQSQLLKTKIIKRYKRFLSDMELDGKLVNAHVPNTGSMKTCWQEGWSAYISKSDNPKRKLAYTWELTDNGESLICVNTNLPNKIVKEALENGWIPELAEYQNIIPEQKVFDSRIDFLLSDDDLVDAFVEVKNVTLRGEKNEALFPDAISTRGQKHLTDLIKIKQSGKRAVIFYLVNRQDVSLFKPAVHIDPDYAFLLKKAASEGVEILVYQTQITTQEIKVHRPLPYELN